MNDIKVLFELQSTSDEISSEIIFTLNKGKSTIRFHYNDENMIEKAFYLEVTNVFKFIFTSDSACSPFQIEAAYEQLIIINNSVLLEEVKHNAEVLDSIIDKATNHFMLYIPDYGCYEFIAEHIFWDFQNKKL